MDKNKVKALLSESSSLIDERKEISAQITDILKKDTNYITMVSQKKELEKAIKEKEERLVYSLLEEKKKINENLKLIKEDLSEDLDVKKKLVGKLITFYKTKLDTNQDELDEIVNAWLSIFEEN